jgi:hypothetical protein
VPTSSTASTLRRSSEASAGYLAAIGKAVGQAIGVRVDDLPLRLENIERALWARPDSHCLILRLANRPLPLTILPPTNVRFEVIRRNDWSLA